MNFKEKPELISAILNIVYNDGAHLKVRLDNVFIKLGLSLTKKECIAFINKTRLDDLLRINQTYFTDHEDEINKPIGYAYEVSLTDNAKKLIDKYGSYINYVNSEAKKEKSVSRNDKLDKGLKLTTGIIAIIATISTIILSIKSLTDKQERNSLEQDKQRMQREMDSLQQVLSTQVKPK